jgi:hypothetical protein
LTSPQPGRNAAPRSRKPLIAVFLVTLAPIVAAVIMYFNPQWWPADSSNYGALVQPQRPMPAASALPLTQLDGKPFDLNSLKGKWVLAAADSGDCADSCARKLFITRNTHASQGKNVDRLVRVFFVTDDAPVPEKVLKAYEGTIMLRADPRQLAAFLLDQGERADAAALAAPIWVLDPLGNLMLRFPADADPVRVRQDISKLIYSSRIG